MSTKGHELMTPIGHGRINFPLGGNGREATIGSEIEKQTPTQLSGTQFQI